MISTNPFRILILSAVPAMLCLPVGAQVGAASGPGGNNPSVGQIALGSLLPASVPYKINQGMIQIKVAISDGIPQDAVLATALPLTVVSPALAVKQSLKTTNPLDLATFLGSVKAIGLASQSVHVGRLLLSGVPLVQFDLGTHLSKKGLAEGPSVWLGTSALGGIVTTIDPERQNIILSPPNTPLPNGCIKVPFELRDGRIYVQLKINDKQTAECILDTTAAGTMLPADVCKSLNLTSLATFATTNTDGKPIKVSAIEVPQVALGGLKFKDVQAVYVSEGVDTRPDASAGVLGNDVLLHYRVTIHYPQRILAFEPSKTPGASPTLQSAPGAGLPSPIIGNRPVRRGP